MAARVVAHGREAHPWASWAVVLNTIMDNREDMGPSSSPVGVSRTITGSLGCRGAVDSAVRPRINLIRLGVYDRRCGAGPDDVAHAPHGGETRKIAPKFRKCPSERAVVWCILLN